MCRLPLDDDDLLSEILLRLPPQPSSLPRASAVCKRWRGIASDPAFSRRFRRHHRRNPPLLGYFQLGNRGGMSFIPTLDPPNRVPPGRFSLQLHRNFEFMGSTHGLVLLFDLQFLVWDPVTGQQHRLPNPPGVDLTDDQFQVQGALLCSPAAEHFKVVLLLNQRPFEDRLCFACVYSSQTGVWAKKLISTPFIGGQPLPALLVGDSLYWKLCEDILVYDLERESLSAIQAPPHADDCCYSILIRAQGGAGLGLFSLSDGSDTTTAHLWKRNAYSQSWEMETTIQLDFDPGCYLSYAEDNNLVVMSGRFDENAFSLHLESLQFKTLPGPTDMVDYAWHTLESVYAAGI